MRLRREARPAGDPGGGRAGRRAILGFIVRFVEQALSVLPVVPPSRVVDRLRGRGALTGFPAHGRTQEGERVPGARA